MNDKITSNISIEPSVFNSEQSRHKHHSAKIAKAQVDAPSVDIAFASPKT